MVIKVCDALCGAGKTSACIRMMNERTDQKFIFVTQFLSEVERIKAGCASRGFVSPDGGLVDSGTKLADIHRLLKNGDNIATTHALFISYTEETKRMIRERGYILVLDEAVDILCMSDIGKCDINLLLKGQTVEEEDGVIKWLYDTYAEEDRDGRGRFRAEMLLAKSKNLLRYDDEYFFWSIPPELFTCFKEAYVLTYLFHAQTMSYFLKLYDLDYELIGVKRGADGYCFCPVEEMDRRRDLRSNIHILDNVKLNEIGAGRTSLSFTWYKKKINDDPNGEIERIRKNLQNLFRNIYGATGDEAMWTTFKDFEDRISSKGIANSFVTYNKRASNEYAGRHYLAYCVNNFMRPWESRYFKDHSVEVDSDTYAVSILVQWIFRSGIRNGEDIWVYIPSRRMRMLFKQWIDKLAEGRDLEPFIYNPKRGIHTLDRWKGDE